MVSPPSQTVVMVQTVVKSWLKWSMGMAPLTFVTFDCLAASNWQPGHPRRDSSQALT